MIGKTMIAASLVAAFSLPAFAATEYWVAKDAATNKCEIMETKPDGVKMLEVGKTPHETKADAKASAQCK